MSPGQCKYWLILLAWLFQGEAIVAAAVFATLQPAAAAAAQKSDDASSAQKSGQGRSSKLETDLTADSVALAIEGILDESLTEETGACAAAVTGAAFKVVSDPHTEQNALKIAATAARTGMELETASSLANDTAAPEYAVPAAEGGNGGIDAAPNTHEVQAGRSDGEHAPAAVALEQGSDKHTEHWGINANEALSMLPPTMAREPDLAIGLLWALPEEARDTTGATKRGAVISAGSDTCMEREALLASSLAEVADRNAMQTRPRQAASRETDGTARPERRQKKGTQTTASKQIASVCKNRPAAHEAAPPVKLAAEARKEARASRSQGVSPAAVAGQERLATLNPRDSAAERHAERQRCPEPGTVDEKFLWQSRWRLGQLLDKGSMRLLHDTSAGGTLSLILDCTDQAT